MHDIIIQTVLVLQCGPYRVTVYQFVGSRSTISYSPLAVNKGDTNQKHVENHFGELIDFKTVTYILKLKASRNGIMQFIRGGLRLQKQTR